MQTLWSKAAEAWHRGKHLARTVGRQEGRCNLLFLVSFLNFQLTSSTVRSHSYLPLRATQAALSAVVTETVVFDAPSVYLPGSLAERKKSVPALITTGNRCCDYKFLPR